MNSKPKFDKNTFVPVNEIFARGKVIRTGKSDYGPYELTMITKVRRREPLTLSFTLDKNCGIHVKEKEIITLSGYTRAFTRYNEIMKRETETLFFVATHLEHEVPELAKRFGEGYGHFCGEGVFRAFLSGTVVKAERINNSYGKITLQTSGGGSDSRPSYPVLRYFINSYLPAFDYRPGDILAVKCSAATPEGKNFKKGQKPYFFQNLIVEDVDYLYKMPRQEAQGANLAPDVDFGITPEMRTQMEIDDMLSSFNASLEEEEAQKEENSKS